MVLGVWSQSWGHFLLNTGPLGARRDAGYAMHVEFCRLIATSHGMARGCSAAVSRFGTDSCDNLPSQNLKVFMAKKAPVVVAAPPEAARTKPLPIPETKFKTIWQVVGTPAATTKAKGDKSAVAA
jgi:hypothetical protein